MTDKWKLDEIRIGDVMEATFWVNPVSESPFRVRATHLNGKRAAKIVLSDDPAIQPGVPCLVRIMAIRKPNRDDRGAIEVEFVRAITFRLEGVYLDPLIAQAAGPAGKRPEHLAGRSPGLRQDGSCPLDRRGARHAFRVLQLRGGDRGDRFPGHDPGPRLGVGPAGDRFHQDRIVDRFGRSGSTTQAALPGVPRRVQSLPGERRNALMPALDTTRRIFHPIENRFIAIPENVQVIAAVNRGQEFTSTFGIDAAQLDRFAPLQLDYMPAAEEVKLLRSRHPELGEKLVESIVEIANRVRKSHEIAVGLSVRDGRGVHLLEAPAHGKEPESDAARGLEVVVLRPVLRTLGRSDERGRHRLGNCAECRQVVIDTSQAFQ